MVQVHLMLKTVTVTRDYYYVYNNLNFLQLFALTFLMYSSMLSQFHKRVSVIETRLVYYNILVLKFFIHFFFFFQYFQTYTYCSNRNFTHITFYSSLKLKD